MRSLVQQLERTEYSTIVYMFSNSSTMSDWAAINDTLHIDSQRLENFNGFCDVLATELSSLYRKNIVFWPCPTMMVSEIDDCRQIFSFHSVTHTA